MGKQEFAVSEKPKKVGLPQYYSLKNIYVIGIPPSRSFINGE